MSSGIVLEAEGVERGARSENMTEIAGFDAVRLWCGFGRGRGDALPLLLKCERGVWWILR